MTTVEGWVRITPETLPKVGQSVALVNVNRWENCPGTMRRNVHSVGYLTSMPGWTPSCWWSIRGERASELDAFTHWFPLPDAPGLCDESESENQP